LSIWVLEIRVERAAEPRWMAREKLFFTWVVVVVMVYKRGS
jgi:hypothetical protein